jgi:hypothetical protein
MLSSIHLFVVIPEKAGIHLLIVRFPTGLRRKIHTQVLDPHLRGGDELVLI